MTASNFLVCYTSQILGCFARGRGRRGRSEIPPFFLRSKSLSSRRMREMRRKPKKNKPPKYEKTNKNKKGEKSSDPICTNPIKAPQKYFDGRWDHLASFESMCHCGPEVIGKEHVSPSALAHVTGMRMDTSPQGEIWSQHKKVMCCFPHLLSVPLPTIQSETWPVHAKVREPHLNPPVRVNFPGVTL